MNLLHHLVVADILHDRLRWPRRVRGAMMLATIAPDAHTEMGGAGRSMLHPPEGEDPVQFVLERIRPRSCLRESEGRAFALSCVGHLVADEMTRGHAYHLPPHAPTGFQPIEEIVDEDPGLVIIDVGEWMRDLIRAEMPCMLSPLTWDAVDSKLWEVLARYPFDEEEGLFLVVEPLATVARECAVETLTRVVRSERGARLVGSWRA